MTILGARHEQATRPETAHLDQIVNLLRQHTPANRAYPAVESFLRTIVCRDTFNGVIVTILGARKLLSAKTSSAPMCNLPEGVPFVQFAYWTGEEDGDAWVFDLEYGVIRCLPVSVGDASLEHARAVSYGVFSNIHHFVGYLKTEAELLEWLPFTSEVLVDKRQSSGTPNSE